MQRMQSEKLRPLVGIGVIINTITALMFVRSNELNNRAAFLHMAADALVSLAVVFGGLAMNRPSFGDRYLFCNSLGYVVIV
jgi:Co/Zn/Cd efflux system component